MNDAVDPYSIRAHVPDFEDFVAAWRNRSLQSRERLDARYNLAFGDGPQDRLDLFFPTPATTPMPVHVFVHGGYWRAFSKDDFSFIADTVVASGAVAAIIDYSLMPMARMETLVFQTRRACAWIAANAASFGGDADRLTISGHSAGAHLAAMACLPDSGPYRLRSALLVSGLYELEPVSRCFVQAEIGLTSDEISRFSPLRLPGNRAVRYQIAVGEYETVPFHENSRDYARHLTAGGCTAELATVEGEQHVGIVLAMGTPGTACAQLLKQQIKQS